MGNMKSLSLFLLFMLIAKPWTSCHAQRKSLMVLKEVEGKGGPFLSSRKLLSQAADEENGMETEFILPDDSDDEKPEVMIDAETKRFKQQKDSLMEALKEQTHEEEKPKKQQEGESILSENGDADLLLEESKEEKWVGESIEKKKYIGEEALPEKDSSGLVTGERVQKQVEGKMETKKEKALVDEKLEEDQPAYTGKVKESKGLPNEASSAGIAEIDMGTDKEGDNGMIRKKGKPNKQTVEKHEASKEVEAEKLENENVSENVKHKLLDHHDLETNKPKEEGSGTRSKGSKGSVFEGSRSKVSDDKDLTGEALAEEMTEEEPPADLMETEMQGGMEDSDMDASKEKNTGGKEQQKKVATHKTKLVDISESEGEEDTEKPSNKIKTLKKSNSDVLQDVDSELQRFSASDDKHAQAKLAKRRDSRLESNVMSTNAGDNVDLLSEQADMENTVKTKQKKKEKVKSDKLKKEERSYKKAEENPFDDIQQEGNPYEKIKRKQSEKVEGWTSKKTSNKAGKKKQSIVKEAIEGSEQDTQNMRILEVVDSENDNAVKDKKKKGGTNENSLKGREEELQTIQKQEEKFDIEVQGIAKEAQEKAEDYNSMPKLGSTQGADEEDDEYNDFMQDFSDMSTTFQDTAIKVADHLGPNIQKLTDTSKTYFNKANQHITESFSSIVGKQFAPFLASLVSYGLLLAPLAVVILLFEHIRALLSLQKVLLFVNIYLAAYFATLLLATFIMGEPMAFFYKSSASGYVHLQILQALGYIIYLMLQTVDLAASCLSEAVSVKVTVLLQWFVAVTVGFHYYVTVFHRAMALKGPHTNWKIYGIYSTAFLVLCLFARIKRLKKGYVQIGQEDTDKKH